METIYVVGRTWYRGLEAGDGQADDDWWVRYNMCRKYVACIVLCTRCIRLIPTLQDHIGPTSLEHPYYTGNYPSLHKTDESNKLLMMCPSSPL